MYRWLIGTVAAAVFLLAPPATANAQKWAREMFDETQHDFGTVARGSKTEFVFEFKNKYRETVHVAAIRSSCGCTTPEVTKDTLKAGESGGIRATFNTTTFTGTKAATLTVVFDRPYYAEVQLHVTGEIATDVQLDPAEIAFGEVAQGSEAERNLQVTFTRHPNLRITDVRSLFPHIGVRLGEPRLRQGILQYTMSVTLKPTAPEGELNERLTLVTNDPRLKTVVIGVTGRVRAPLEVRPDSVHLAAVAPEKSASERLLVRADQPFEIQRVDCDDDRFSFDIPEGAKKVHFVKMTFTNDGSASGAFRVPVTIVSNLAGDASAACIVTGEATAQ